MAAWYVRCVNVMCCLKSKTPHSGPSNAVSPSVVSDVSTGLDATLLDALRSGNPLALQATAGLIDNSLMQRLLGTDRTDVRESARDESRSGSAPGVDLSEHGSIEPTVADRVNHQFWRNIAVAAEGMGLVNAARHMHRFLDNDGSPIELDVEQIYAASSKFAAAMATLKAELIEDAYFSLDFVDWDKPHQWQMHDVVLSGDQTYIGKSDSQDWFYAMGGNTHTASARVAYPPGSDIDGMLFFNVNYNVYDMYNWDEGKSVTIAGITVRDEDLGRLHATGLAQEFEMSGDYDASFNIVAEAFAPETPSRLVWEESPEATDGRSDADRERK